MTTFTSVKTDLLMILNSIKDVSATFDYATLDEEAEKGIVIDDFSMTYEHDLDMGYHKTVRFTAFLMTKTSDDLDDLIDALESLDNDTETSIRNLTLESVSISDDDIDNKFAKASMSCFVWD
jgi:hypothetical protein